MYRKKMCKSDGKIQQVSLTIHRTLERSGALIIQQQHIDRRGSEMLVNEILMSGFGDPLVRLVPFA